MPNGSHVVDQTPSLIWAYAEQFSDLAPVDELCGYVFQRGADQRHPIRPGWQPYFSAIPMLSISGVHNIHTNHSTTATTFQLQVF